MKAIVLCAGYGTRLGNLTSRTPKPMLPIVGQPLLAYTLKYLASYDFLDIAINLHFEPDQIINYFAGGDKYGVKIHYSYEERLLGTAGTVKNLETWWEDEEDILILYGDILTDQNLDLLWNKHKLKRGLATVLLHQRPYSNSLVQMDDKNRITAFIERPTDEQRIASPYPWVYSGIQFINRGLLNFMPSDRTLDFPRDIFAKLIPSERFYGLPLTGYRCAIDSPSRYVEAEAAVSEGRYRPKYLPTPSHL